MSWSDDRLLRAFYAVSFVGSVVIACSIVLGPVFLAPAKNILHETELSQDTSKTIFASFLFICVSTIATMPPYAAADCFGEYSQSVVEIKPRLDLWTTNSSFDSTAWSFPPHKRRVRFAPRHVVEVEYINLDGYTYEEVEACWYSHSDYEQFRQSRKIDCHEISSLFKGSAGSRLSSSEEDGDDRMCTTGLESPQESLECRLRIRDAVAAVLEEQNYQRCFYSCYYEYNVDFFAIAERYGNQVLYCAELARFRGEQQALDVHGLQPICCGA